MGFWVALLITLAVLGSVMWVMPSPRERSLTALRNRALGLGLKVRLVDERLAKALFPWLDNFRVFTLYEKFLPSGKKPNTYKARVLRLTVDPHAHEVDLEDPLRSLFIEHGLVDDLPGTVEALVISSTGVALLWRERQANSESVEEVEKINACLQCCIDSVDLWLPKY